jgi:hypothetical protein
MVLGAQLYQGGAVSVPRLYCWFCGKVVSQLVSQSVVCPEDEGSTFL